MDLMARWRDGDQQAATELFRRYVDRLIALVRSRLAGKVAHRIDPEDVVQSVYRTFFADVRDGRYLVERGGDMWQLLVTITLHKVNDQIRRNKSEKRDFQKEQGFGSEDSLIRMQAHLLAHEPSPLEAVALAEEVEQIMRRLEPIERRMLELRLQGFTIDEIAADTHCGERTVRYALDEVKQQLHRWSVANFGS
jgi:RNA polymerase sigma factor (sigma-70 family)